MTTENRKPKTENRHLVVGLGNPGPQYAWTRHNLGFMVAAALAELWGIPLTRSTMDATWGQGRVGGKTVVLAQPATFMNLSGRAVSRLLAYFKFTPAALVVVHDDLDVPLGRLKIVERGGPGGHKGVLSIINALDTEEFIRVKLGIGRPRPEIPSENFVLSPFAREEEETVATLVERGAQAVDCLIREGLQAAQNRFHGTSSE
ncbi:MAG: aminoacyl-tRNA hydrolase [Deltaproteobacteria bacterium]|nr:aminoacyl-tRNA hydrolase [Deltaproteobacteria bacterium]